MNIITVKNVTKIFHLGKVQVTALDDVSMTVDKGEFLAIAGPSGSGKTTLLNLIGCIDKADKGDIEIDGQDVTRMNSNQLADIRASKLSFIFQTFNLIPVLSAYENVEYPLLMSEKNPAKRRDRILQALHNVGLDSHIKHRPDELSGGQRQRVAIARALVTEPKIILADEPTANLDIKTGEKILEIMKQINEEKKTIFVFSTHDPKVMGMASRIINIRDGKISKYSHFDRRIGIENGSYQGEERRTGTQRREFI
ncbi:MAG: ABC transporter ATP-binding protein [Desulfobacter postgatei]|uniref:ABC transporter ATP-binding protein n=1 Tax=Desulfobacter postgatei TaxID=2293 RepID=UPI0023F2429A|nr:ABC transporter ATP-binding protein [Desulfobacter postgatei]MDD4272878.1 ABC transporter ATP-binding protein [Desulfobacter postgatei]